MADNKKRTGGLVSDAVIAAGKDRARRVIDDLTLSAEEKARREEERARSRRILKWKLIAGGVVAALVILWVVSIFARLWLWGIGLAILLAAGGTAYVLARRKVRGFKKQRIASPEAPRVVLPPVAPKTSALTAAARKEREEQEIDEELAALKKKARR